MGFVGRVVEIDGKLTGDSPRGRIPVIPSIAVDRTGQRYNVNADTAAAAVARTLDAEKLVFLSDVPGIFLRPNLTRDSLHVSFGAFTAAGN